MKALPPLLLSLVFLVNTQAGILPTNAVVGGKTIGDWTARYYQWSMLQPTNQHPAFDADGSHATNGQAGPVFFVPGGFYSGAQPPRHYAVREGKFLFLPLVVIEADNIDTFPPLPVEELREIAGDLIDTTSQLHLRLDGIATTNLFDHRRASPVFSFDALSADNLFTYFYGHPITGLIDPAVADGYWIMIEPPGLGSHALEFGGTYGSPISYSYERSDIITIVPASPMELIEDLVHTVETSALTEKQQQTMIRNLSAARDALNRERVQRNVAASRLRAFEKQVCRSLPQESAAASNWIQRAETVINRTLSQLPPITNGDALPVDATVDGKTIGGLTVDLWKWIYSIPTNQNPQLDCGSGQWATNRQPNPLVFFIAGVNGNMPPCSRTFTVPEHKHILMPVMGVQLDNIDIVPPLTEPEMRDLLDSVLSRNPVELFATVDGLAVPNLINRRIFAPPFSVNFLDADNISSFFYKHPVIGLIDPNISDGYWLLLEPLSTGQHVLHGYGTNIYHLPHDTTSHITVEPVPLAEWMAALKHWIQNDPASLSRAGKLMPSLNQADALFRRGKHRAGIAELRAFQGRVRTHLLNAEPILANDLMRYAERIIYRAGKEL